MIHTSRWDGVCVGGGAFTPALGSHLIISLPNIPLSTLIYKIYIVCSSLHMKGEGDFRGSLCRGMTLKIYITT